MRNSRSTHKLRLSSAMTTVVFLAICITVLFTGHTQAEVVQDDIRVPVVSWTPTGTYSAMTQPPPGTQVVPRDDGFSQTKDLPDYEPLDRDEFLGQVESAMATRGFSERIDHFSGTLHLNQVDLVLPGNAGLDIVIQHYYSSNVWNRVDNSLLKRHVSSADLGDRLGHNGWQMHMGKLLNLSPGVNNFTTLIMPDGSTHTLYSRDGHEGEKITPEGWIYSEAGSVSTVQTTTGLRYHFDSAASGAQYTYLGVDNGNPIQVLQCTRIEDLNGNAIVIEYSQAPANSDYENRIDRISFDDDTDLRDVVFTYNGDTAILNTMQLRNDGTAIETWTFTYYGPPYIAFQPQFGGSEVRVYPLANVVHSITSDYANEKITNAWQYNYYEWRDPDPAPLTDGLLLIESVVSPRVGKVAYTWGPEVMDTGALSCVEAIPAFLTVQTRTTAVAISDNPIVYEDETTSTYTYTDGGQEDATTSVVTTDSQTSVVLSTDEHVFHGWTPGAQYYPQMWNIGLEKSSTVVLKDDAGADLETTTTNNVWEQSSQFSATSRWSSAWAGCSAGRYSGYQRYVKPTTVTTVVERHDSIPDTPPVPPPDPASYTTVSSGFDDYGNVGLVTESSDDGLSRTTNFTYWQETNNIKVGRVRGRYVNPGGMQCFQYDTLGRVEHSYTNPPSDDVEDCTLAGSIVGARQVDYAYDENGNLHTQTEISTTNRVTTHTNHLYGKPKETTIATGTGTDIHYCRDYKPRGMTAWETDGRGCATNYKTVYGYDFLGRRTSADPPLSDPVIYSYPTFSAQQRIPRPQDVVRVQRLCPLN